MAWQTVAEYKTNPIASDRDEEKRPYTAEGRASRKAKAQRVKKRPARAASYGRPRPGPKVPVTMQMPAAAQQCQGMCFLCG